MRDQRSNNKGQRQSRTYAPFPLPFSTAVVSACQVRPMWSRQGLRPTPPEASFFHGAPGPAPAPAPALRPFSSSCDQLGRAMSREVLSRSTAGLKPQQFDTTQRRCEYACALVGKREARLLRKAGEEVASKVVRSFDHIIYKAKHSLGVFLPLFSEQNNLPCFCPLSVFISY